MSPPIANPLVEGLPSPVAAQAPRPDEPPPTSGPAAQLPSFGGIGFGGMGNFTHPDNTATHVAVLVGIAGAVVAFFYWGGFKFAVDVGATRG